MTIIELPFPVLTTIYQVKLYEYSVVLQEMVNGQASERRGKVIGARTAREESCHAGHRRGEDGYGASTSVYGTTCVTSVSLSSNTKLEEVKKLAYTGWNRYLVKSETIQYKKCTGTIDIGKF